MKLFFFLIILYNIKLIYSYGEGINNRPTWKERESLVLVNALRMDPIGYKSIFMEPYGYKNLDKILLPPGYSPSTPLYYDLKLSESSRYHSFDMGWRNYFNHTTPNGEAFSKRIRQYTNCSSLLLENISAGNLTGFYSNNLLICENTTKQCVSDDNPSHEIIGHRLNLMNKRVSIVGIGLINTKNPKSKYTTYWTQNFGNNAHCLSDKPISNSPIHSGSHTFLNDTKYERNPNFLVTFSSTNESVKQMELHIQNFNSPIIMNQILGFNSSFAVYSYQTTTGYISCNWYYYLVRTKSGNTYRYPDTGILKISNSKSPCFAWYKK